MKITEVRIFPTESKDGKLKAFATMTFDDWFVVRNVKVIQGTNSLFVAMPSRKAVDPCPKCSFKNARGSRFCNHCGAEMAFRSASSQDDRKLSAHMDVAHPITQECRVYIQDRILEEYKREKERQQFEGVSYRPPTEDDLNAISSQFSSDHKKTARAASPSVSFENANDIEL